MFFFKQVVKDLEWTAQEEWGRKSVFFPQLVCVCACDYDQSAFTPPRADPA